MVLDEADESTSDSISESAVETSALATDVGGVDFLETGSGSSRGVSFFAAEGAGWILVFPPGPTLYLLPPLVIDIREPAL